MNPLKAAIQEMRERCEAATPGPWELTLFKDETGCPVEAEVSAGTMGIYLSDLDYWEERWPEGIANARLIAAARSDLPKLLSALEVTLEALEYVKHRTEQCPEKGMHPHGFIRSTRMRGTVNEALSKAEQLLTGSAPSPAGAKE